MEYEFVVFIVMRENVYFNRCQKVQQKIPNEQQIGEESERERERLIRGKGERYVKRRMFHSSLSTFDRYQVKFGVRASVWVCVCV